MIFARLKILFLIVSAAGLLAACAASPNGFQSDISASRVLPRLELPPSRLRVLPLDEDEFAETPPRPENAVIVALLLPLSDRRKDVSELAKAMSNAAQLALFEANDHNLVLAIHDTKGTQVGAAAAVRAALVGDAGLIIGPLFSASVSAISPYLAYRDVPALAFSNNSGAAAKNIWLTGFLPENNIERIVITSIDKGLTRFAALVPEGDFGDYSLAVLREYVTRYGGTLVDTQSYPPNAEDMFEPVRELAQFEYRKEARAEELERLKKEARKLVPRDTPESELFKVLENNFLPAPGIDLLNTPETKEGQLVAAYKSLKLAETWGEIPYDVVFMPEGGLNLRNLVPLLPYYDIDPKLIKFVGTGLWDDPTLAKEPPLHGAWYAAPPSVGYDAFSSRYKKYFDAAPPRLASLAYDGVSIAAQLRRMDRERPFSRELLLNANGFASVDGIFRLAPDGRNERGLAVREITPQRAQVVSRAPRSFAEQDRRRTKALALAEKLQLARERDGLDTPSQANVAGAGGTPLFRR